MNSAEPLRERLVGPAGADRLTSAHQLLEGEGVRPRLTVDDEHFPHVLTLHRQHERRPIDVLGRKAAAAVAGGIDPEVGERADDAFRSGSIGLQQADGADLDVKAAILEAPAQEGLRHRRPAQVPGAHDEHRLPLRDGDRRASTRSAAGHRRIVALVDRAMNGGGAN